jgi:thymidine kinase
MMYTTMPTGRLTVFSGPMFAGKTEALIEAALKTRPGERKVYKPTVDTRHDGGYLLSHGGVSIEAEWLDPDLTCVVQARHIFIDEAQFLTHPSIRAVISLLKAGSNLALAGLDLDSNGVPFGCMPTFLALADTVIKVQGTCASCGRPSCRTASKVRVEGIVIGGSEMYEPKCLSCFPELV